MNAHNRLPARPWILFVGVLILLLAHGLVFYFVHHLALSVTLLSGVAVLIVVKHLGALSSLYAMLRKRMKKANNCSS